MNPSAPSPIPSSLAERMAWMHQPVHLGHVRLPWFLRWYFETALHRMFCTLEQGLLTLLDLQRQGKLEPWPEEPDITLSLESQPGCAEARRGRFACASAEAAGQAGSADRQG